MSVDRVASEGHAWDAIERVIRSKASGPNANPWYLDEWLREAAADHFETQRALEKQRENLERNRELDARAEEEWAQVQSEHPGLSRREVLTLRGLTPVDFRTAGQDRMRPIHQAVDAARRAAMLDGGGV